MANALGSAFELSLRLLLLLNIAGDKKFSSDALAGLDFIIVYSRDFGLSEKNLHGEGSFRFSEFAFRRENTKEAIKQLVTKGLVDIAISNSGFCYGITEHGRNYLNDFDDSYAFEYEDTAETVLASFESEDERAITETILKKSTASLILNNED